MILSGPEQLRSFSSHSMNAVSVSFLALDLETIQKRVLASHPVLNGLQMS